MLLYILPLLALAIVLLWIFKPFKKWMVERNKEPLPAQYASFLQVDTNYTSNEFKVQLLCKTAVSLSSWPNPIRAFLSVNDQLIVSCVTEQEAQRNTDYQYFKLNSKGEVIGSLQVPSDGYRGEFISEYMVFTEGGKPFYTTWPLNGDRTEHQISNLNADLSWSDERIQKTIDLAKTNSRYYFFKSHSEEGKFFRQFFFVDPSNNWQMLLQKMPGYVSIRDEESARRYRNDVFQTGEDESYLPENVNLLFFYPQEKMTYAHVIGGGAPGFHKYDWRGNVFFSTDIAGKTFEFSVPKLVIEKEKFDHFKTRLYRVDEPGSAVKLFSPSFYTSTNFALYAADGRTLYLIRKK